MVSPEDACAVLIGSTEDFSKALTGSSSLSSGLENRRLSLSVVWVYGKNLVAPTGPTEDRLVSPTTTIEDRCGASPDDGENF